MRAAKRTRVRGRVVGDGEAGGGGAVADAPHPEPRRASDVEMVDVEEEGGAGRGGGGADVIDLDADGDGDEAGPGPGLGFMPAGAPIGARAVSWQWGEAQPDITAERRAAHDVIRRPWEPAAPGPEDQDFIDVYKDLKKQQENEAAMLEDPGWRFMMQVAGMAHCQMDHLGRYKRAGDADWPHLVGAVGESGEAPEVLDGGLNVDPQSVFLKRVVQEIRTLQREGSTEVNVCVHTTTAADTKKRKFSGSGYPLFMGEYLETNSVPANAAPGRSCEDVKTECSAFWWEARFDRATNPRAPPPGAEWGTVQHDGQEHSGWVQDRFYRSWGDADLGSNALPTSNYGKFVNYLGIVDPTTTADVTDVVGPPHLLPGVRFLDYAGGTATGGFTDLREQIKGSRPAVLGPCLTWEMPLLNGPTHYPDVFPKWCAGVGWGSPATQTDTISGMVRELDANAAPGATLQRARDQKTQGAIRNADLRYPAVGEGGAFWDKPVIGTMEGTADYVGAAAAAPAAAAPVPQSTFVTDWKNESHDCHGHMAIVEIPLDLSKVEHVLLAAYAGAFSGTRPAVFGELVDPPIADDVRVAGVTDKDTGNTNSAAGCSNSNIANARFRRLNTLMRFYTGLHARGRWIGVTDPIASRIDTSSVEDASQQAMEFATGIAEAEGTRARAMGWIGAAKETFKAAALWGMSNFDTSEYAMRTTSHAVDAISNAFTGHWRVLTSKRDGEWTSPLELESMFVDNPRIDMFMVDSSFEQLHNTDRARAQISAFLRTENRGWWPGVPNPKREKTVFPKATTAMAGFRKTAVNIRWETLLTNRLRSFKAASVGGAAAPAPVAYGGTYAQGVLVAAAAAGGAPPQSISDWTIEQIKRRMHAEIHYKEAPFSPFEMIVTLPPDPMAGVLGGAPAQPRQWNQQIDGGDIIEKMKERADELTRYMESGPGGEMVSELRRALADERLAMMRHRGMELRARETAATHRVVFEPLMLGAIDSALFNVRSISNDTFGACKSVNDFVDPTKADPDVTTLFAKLCSVYINQARHSAGRSYMHLGLASSYGLALRAVALQLRRVVRRAGRLVMGPPLQSAGERARRGRFV